MRIKTDENLHPETAAFLREHGHDALTVWDQDLRGRADADLAEACRTEGRAFLTLDMGFADIREYPPELSAGLIVLRVGSQSRRHVLALIERMIPLLRNEPVASRLWVVDEHSVRIRGQDEAADRP